MQHEFRITRIISGGQTGADQGGLIAARERVQEAYDRLREVQLAWLPDLRAGPAYQRHDGEIQNAAGFVFETSKSNLFIGGGAVMAVDTSEAIFGPLVARRLVEAQRASAQAVTNSVQLDVALTYLDLLRVYAALAVNADTLARTDEMVRFTEGAEKAVNIEAKGDVEGPITAGKRVFTFQDTRKPGLYLFDLEVEGGEPCAAVLTVDAVGPLYGSLSDGDVEERLARGEFVFLGLIDERAHFALDVSAGEWLINPGSTGQPRDGDPRAAWLVMDIDAKIATYRRSEYDIAGAMAAIRAAGLPDSLAERLQHGQ